MGLRSHQMWSQTPKFSGGACPQNSLGGWPLDVFHIFSPHKSNSPPPPPLNYISRKNPGLSTCSVPAQYLLSTCSVPAQYLLSTCSVPAQYLLNDFAQILSSWWHVLLCPMMVLLQFDLCAQEEKQQLAFFPSAHPSQLFSTFWLVCEWIGSLPRTRTVSLRPWSSLTRWLLPRAGHSSRDVWSRDEVLFVNESSCILC